jgi:hypothetical protein
MGTNLAGSDLNDKEGLVDGYSYFFLFKNRFLGVVLGLWIEWRIQRFHMYPASTHRHPSPLPIPSPIRVV